MLINKPRTDDSDRAEYLRKHYKPRTALDHVWKKFEETKARMEYEAEVREYERVNPDIVLR